MSGEGVVFFFLFIYFFYFAPHFYFLFAILFSCIDILCLPVKFGEAFLCYT
jgi:hypothetical protein